MTVAYINKIVGYADGSQYQRQEIQAAIPAPSTQLARIRVQLRSLPRDVKADLFARDTMATWFRMTGVGTPIERIQDRYTLDQIKAIEISCKHKLREYQIVIQEGMTARATLMGHIFDRAVLNIDPNQAYEILKLRDHCAIERGESRLTPTRMLYMKLAANRVAAVALRMMYPIFRYALPLALFSVAAPLTMIVTGTLSAAAFYLLGMRNMTFLGSIAGVTASITYFFCLVMMESLERRARVLDFRFYRLSFDLFDSQDNDYMVLLGDARRTWLQVTCEGEQQNGAPQ